MDRYRKVRPLSAPDAAYVAGLVDGEGSISLTRRHAKDHRQLVISISNTEKAILVHVASVVGAGRIVSKATYRPNHTPSYAYLIENRQALALLCQVQPYLRSYKAERGKLVLENYVRLTPRNGKYAERQLDDRARFVRTFFSITAHGNSSKSITRI
jgi:hypothetical protein